MSHPIQQMKWIASPSADLIVPSSWDSVTMIYEPVPRSFQEPSTDCKMSHTLLKRRGNIYEFIWQFLVSKKKVSKNEQWCKVSQARHYVVSSSAITSIMYPNVSAAGNVINGTGSRRDISLKICGIIGSGVASVLKRVGRTGDKGVSQNEGISNQKVMQPKLIINRRHVLW